jgi:nucleoside-diphosphate-sugar epimerase
MNILVTGAAGGIGSTLSYSLCQKGHNLVLIDNLRNGYEENLKINNSTFGLFLKKDIRDINDIDSTIKFDAVIHLAAITSLPDCENNIEETISINVKGTTTILEFCRKRNIPYVFFASTSAVYEQNKENILSEELHVFPRLWYSLSKKMAEEICESYRHNYNMKITTARFFNVFGPRQDINRKNPPLLNYIVNELKNQRSPILHSDGNQRRDYIHVDDVISFVELCLEKKPNYTLNVCSGKTLSVKEIVEIATQSLNSNIKPIFRNASMLWDTYPSLFEGNYPLLKEVVINETNKNSLGSNKLATELGWNPDVDLVNLFKKTTLEIYNKINLDKQKK